MMSSIRMHFVLIKIALSVRMAYRADFFISATIMLMFEMLVPLLTLLIYRSGAALPGWSLYEVLLIQGVFLLAKGIAFPFFFGIVWNTTQRVKEGTFDLLLIKPRPVLHMAIATSFDSEDLGKLFGGLVLFSAALVHNPQPGLLQWVQFFLMFIVSLAVLFAFSLFMSGLVFKWVGCYRVYEIFESITSFGLYPKSVFSKGFQILITMVIPVAVIGFFPAAVLLGRPIQGYLTAAAASMVFLAAGWQFWHFMLRNYSSAGG